MNWHDVLGWIFPDPPKPARKKSGSSQSVVSIERTHREIPLVLTEDRIIHESPDEPWIPPADARRDPWRPRTTLH